jgi:hypothetical protein
MGSNIKPESFKRSIWSITRKYKEISPSAGTETKENGADSGAGEKKPKGRKPRSDAGKKRKAVAQDEGEDEEVVSKKVKTTHDESDCKSPSLQCSALRLC